MAISLEGIDALKVQEIKDRDFALGKCRVKVNKVLDFEDAYGRYLNFVVHQLSTGKCTLSAEALKNVDYADDPRGYYKVVNSIAKKYINDYLQSEVFDAISETMPSFKTAVDTVGQAGALNALEGNEMTVWFTRTKKGRLMIYFSEKKYQSALGRGEIGGADISNEGDTLNEEVPF